MEGDLRERETELDALAADVHEVGAGRGRVASRRRLATRLGATSEP